MKHKLRILWSSNAMHVGSGYGMQSAEIVPRIHKEGYEIACNDFFGLVGGKVTIDDILHYPVINHAYGSDGMVLHAKDFKADVVFSLMDSWVLHPDDLKQVNRWIPLAPVDYVPTPVNILQNLRLANRIISYSKFGYKMLQDSGLYSTYIPHTVDTKIFKPMDKKERKKKTNLPIDSFLVGMVAANKDFFSRKAFEESLLAFKEFLKVEPKALLYIHSNPDFPNGFPFGKFAQDIGIKERLIVPDIYTMNFNTGKEEMAKIYNNFDVLLAPSKTEGFCVPIIEAQACGVPVITQDWNSMSELIIPEKTGFLVSSYMKQYQPNGSYLSYPSIPDIVNALIKIKDKNRVEMGFAARKYIVANYDSDTIFKEKWIPYLQKLEDEVYPVANK